MAKMHRTATFGPSARTHVSLRRASAKEGDAGAVQESCEGAGKRRAWFGVALAAAWTMAAEARGAGLAVQAQEELRARLEAMPSEQAKKVLQKMSVDELVDIYRATRQNADDNVDYEKEPDEMVQEDWRRAFEKEWQREDEERTKQTQSNEREGDRWAPPIDNGGMGWDVKMAMQRVERTVPGIAALLAVVAAAFVLLRDGGNAVLEMARETKAEEGDTQEEASAPGPVDMDEDRPEKESRNGGAQTVGKAEKPDRITMQNDLRITEENQEDKATRRKSATEGKVLWTREDEEQEPFPQVQQTSSRPQSQPRPPSRKELRRNLDIRTVPREKVESVLKRALEGSWRNDSTGVDTSGQGYVKEDPWKTVYQEDEGK
eukprot:CAMPEP_0183830842 /NCGR_PEP_ID=MMETSP0807_2-20130328/4259_1 /TAXON_ID=88271 /ORGANISM="Picocystis salinarum, Strain CCMP1897" /LENGTH=374 /DNA_ID=CAMNT_0026076231 /DNA_START=1 /DNA_END=1125 /DNA_ORIENTATION=-